MSKLQYVSDGTACISLQGIRWVRKSDTEYMHSTDFTIEIQYKGSVLHLKYKDQADRDKLFSTIKGLLKPAEKLTEGNVQPAPESSV